MRKFLILYLLTVGFIAFSQDAPIFTDRPNVTDAVSLISPGTFQVELGYFRSVNNDQSDLAPAGINKFTSTTIPNFSFKYGLLKWVEVRLISSYEVSKTEFTSLEVFKSEGLTPIIISPKFALFRQSGFLPETSLVTGFEFINTPDSEFNLALTLLMQYTVDRFSLSGSLGTDLHGSSNQDLHYRHTIVGGYTITKKLGAFVELYEFFSDEMVGIDTGFTYLLNDNFQVDVIYDTNLNGINSHAIGFGVAWKTNFKDKM